MVRRSLDDGLTPEQVDFLKGGSPAVKSPPKAKTKPDKPIEGKIAPETPNPSPTVEHPSSASLQPVSPNLVTLNTRIEEALSTGLLRASVDRKIQRRSRAAMQDIVNEALRAWLKNEGYIV